MSYSNPQNLNPRAFFEKLQVRYPGSLGWEGDIHRERPNLMPNDYPKGGETQRYAQRLIACEKAAAAAADQSKMAR